MKKKFLLITFLTIVLFSYGIIAQSEIPELVTDRPDNTDSPIVLPIDYFQIETGFLFEKQKFLESGLTIEKNNLILGSTLLRCGVSTNWEFRFGGEYIITRSFISSNELLTQGMQNIFFGAKYQFRKDQEILSNAGFIFIFGLPFGNEKLRPNNIEPGITLALEHDFSDEIFFSVNAGIYNNSTLGKNIYDLSASLEYGFNYEFSVFAEVFSSYISNLSPNHNVDVGCEYLMKKNIQVDFSIGTSVFSDDTDYFGSLGISIRLPH
ncbi:MAG: transporter [Ignavibacteriales bacterium]|nr:transporter [Ignavibacteriales bacterium]